VGLRPFRDRIDDLEGNTPLVSGPYSDPQTSDSYYTDFRQDLHLSRRYLDILMHLMIGHRSAALALLVQLLALVASGAPVGHAEAREPAFEPRWYRLEIDGTPAGWAVDRIERDGERITTATRMTLRLHRGATEVSFELASRFVETVDGEPVSLWRRQTLGRLPVEVTFRFYPDRIEATTSQAGRESAETFPLPRGEWLTPDATRRAALERRAAGAMRYSLRTLDPFQGITPVTVERELLGFGTAPGAIDRWHERQLGAGGGEAEESVIELDADGRLVASSTTFMGLELTLHVSDRDTAQSGGTGPSPELMVSNFVRPDRAIADPRRLRRAVYELSLAPKPKGDRISPKGDRISPNGGPSGSSELPALPQTAAQRVTPLSAEDTDGGGPRSRLRVEIDVAGGLPLPPVDADGAPAEATTPPSHLSRYLAPSSFLDHQDPAVRALLERPGRPDPPDRDRAPDADRSAAAGSDHAPDPVDPRRRALELAELVHRRITIKTLDTGFGTASEVARTGAGDCTEHAVLLAALLRAEDIPSRVVSGLVYLEEFAGARQVFGYHMWTQALIDDRWLDLDATLPPSPAGSTGFDATHIALGTSALDGPDAVADFLPLTSLLGKLEIRVIEPE